jgi:hypothetical protein
MTTDEMNVAIAECCGWYAETFTNSPHWRFVRNDLKRQAHLHACGHYHHNTKEEASRCLPHYCGDLNAIMGAIKEVILGDADLEEAFLAHLHAILKTRENDDDGPVVFEYELALITASPDEFCEAFLMARGLWK